MSKEKQEHCCSACGVDYSVYTALLEACKHGAMSIHHPACSHGKRGDGNTCECPVKKCQQAIAAAEK